MDRVEALKIAIMVLSEEWKRKHDAGLDSLGSVYSCAAAVLRNQLDELEARAKEAREPK